MEQFWQSCQSVPDGTRLLCSEGGPETLKSTKCLNSIIFIKKIKNRKCKTEFKLLITLKSFSAGPEKNQNISLDRFALSNYTVSSNSRKCLY